MSNSRAHEPMNNNWIPPTNYASVSDILSQSDNCSFILPKREEPDSFPEFHATVGKDAREQSSRMGKNRIMDIEQPASASPMKEVASECLKEQNEEIIDNKVARGSATTLPHNFLPFEGNSSNLGHTVVTSWPVSDIMEAQDYDPPLYEFLFHNTFLARKEKVVKPDDVAVCNCSYDGKNPGLACGPDTCLNAMLCIECTPDYCPTGNRCMNQRFQKCLYPKLRVQETTGRGWGLFACEDIAEGQFVQEYCGEVIPEKVAYKRAAKYESEGEVNAYILQLGNGEYVDATAKGSLARFLNHSCSPNCEARKWTVLGEVRVGVFATQPIRAGQEVTWDYNFEWFGGEKVKCRCGAKACVGFLGAKSKAFKESMYVWEDGDDSLQVENIPTYDSGDGEGDDVDNREDVGAGGSHGVQKEAGSASEDGERAGSAGGLYLEDQNSGLSLSKGLKKRRSSRARLPRKDLGKRKRVELSPAKRVKAKRERFEFAMVEASQLEEGVKQELLRMKNGIEAADRKVSELCGYIHGRAQKGPGTALPFSATKEFVTAKCNFLSQEVALHVKLIEGFLQSRLIASAALQDE